MSLASKATTLLASGAGMVAGAIAFCLALAAPVALDLWAMVEADRSGIRWRNRVRTRSLRWDEVSGFEVGDTSMLLLRRDGKGVAVAALGLRYFGSKAMAEQRVAILEQLRRTALR